MAKPKSRTAAPRRVTTHPASATAPDLAGFQHELLAGFDRLMQTGGLSPVEGEEIVLDGFRNATRVPE